MNFMTKNYFAIERNGQCIDHTHLTKEDGSMAFEDVMDMTYEDIVNYENIESFVVSLMDASNQCFGGNDDDTFVTLVGEDDVFIWGLLIGAGDTNDELTYKFINWKENGQSYRYEKD